MTDKAQRQYPEWKWELYHSDTFFPDCPLLQKDTWNFNCSLWRKYFSPKISYFPIPVSLISVCLSWYKEIWTLGSAQDRGALVFFVGDRFHFLSLTLLFVEMPWNMDSVISKKFQWCIWGQLWVQFSGQLWVPSSSSCRYHLVIFSYMHINS